MVGVDGSRRSKLDDMVGTVMRVSPATSAGIGSDQELDALRLGSAGGWSRAIGSHRLAIGWP